MNKQDGFKVIVLSNEDYRYIIDTLHLSRARLSGSAGIQARTAIAKLEEGRDDTASAFDGLKFEDVLIALRDHYPDPEFILRLLDDAALRPTDDGRDGGVNLPF